MTLSPAILRSSLAGGGAIVLLIACSALLDAGARSSGSRVEQQLIEPVQRVVAPASGADILPDLVDAACPAIVTLGLRSGKHGDAARTGGIIISARGAILAGSRDLRSGDPVDVAFNDGTDRPGQVTAVHEPTGLAIIQVDAVDLKALAFEEDDLPRVGSWGFTLSSPASRGCAVQTGTIMQDFTSDKDGPRGWVATTIAKPAIGLPFIDRDGRVMAFATAIDGKTVSLLPGNIVSRIAGTMARSGKEPTAPFGLIVDAPGPRMAERLQAGRPKGAAVMLVAARSPAARAGLVAGDIILTAGGTPVAAPSEFERVLDAAEGSIELTVQRRGQLSAMILER